MNGSKEFGQTVALNTHRIERNCTILAQQLTNMGFEGVKVKINISFTAEAPDGSGRCTKSIVGQVDKLVPGNGPKVIGGNDRTSLSNAIANSSAGGTARTPTPPIAPSPSSVPVPVAKGTKHSAFAPIGDDSV